MELMSVSPTEFTSYLKSGNTLAIGAPYIGKTKQIRNFIEKNQEVQLLNSLAIEETTGVAVIDEFDLIWRGASKGERTSFREDLEDAVELNLCAVTRPRALDWLLTTDNTDFSTSIIEQFDQLLFIQYNLNDDSQVEEAVDQCLEIGNLDDDAKVNGLSESQVRRSLDRLSYSYRFEADYLVDLIDSNSQYGPTVVPPLIGYLSSYRVKEGLLPKGVVNTWSRLQRFELREFIESTSGLAESILRGELQANTVNQIKDALKKGRSEVEPINENGIREWLQGEFSREGAIRSGMIINGMVPLAGGMVPFAGAAASLLLWTYLRRGDDRLSQDEILTGLAGKDVTPTARATLESELGLPPRTLDDLHWFLTEGNISLVRRACENNPEVVAKFRAKIDDHEDRLKKIESDIKKLKDEMESTSGFYSEQVQNATNRLTVVADILRRDEATLLRPLIEENNIDPDSIPYFDTISSDGDLKGSPPIDELVEKTKQSEMIVLRGPSGTGKTTAAYRLGRMLEEEGYEVRIPNFTDYSNHAIKYALERFVETDKIVLYVSYEIGQDPLVAERDNIRSLGRWIKSDVCNCVIVDCRSELYPSFSSKLSHVNASLKENLRNKVIYFQKFDTKSQKENIVQIISWVAKSANVNSPDEELLDEIISISDGNPEIVKLATRFTLSGEYSLEDIDTSNDLVFRAIENIYNQTEGDSRFYEQLFVLLSVTSGLKTGEIMDILDVKTSDLMRDVKPIQGYLNREIAQALDGDYLAPDDTTSWRLSPDIFAEVTIRNSLSPNNEAHNFWWVFSRLFIDDRKKSYNHYLYFMARNIGIAYNALHHGEDESEYDHLHLGKKECVDAGNKLLRLAVNVGTEKIDPDTFSAMIFALNETEVPYDPLIVSQYLDIAFGSSDSNDVDDEVGYFIPELLVYAPTAIHDRYYFLMMVLGTAMYLERIPFLINQLLMETFRSNPVYQSEIEMVHFAARALADVILVFHNQTWGDGFDSYLFEETLDEISKLDTNQFCAVIEETSGILASGNTSNWLPYDENVSWNNHVKKIVDRENRC